MTPSPNQQRRLLGLLDKLAGVKRGDPVAMQERMQRTISFGVSGMNGQEHQDIITLFHSGHIESRSYIGHDPVNSWSAEGIYAYEITPDGEEYLEMNRHILEGGSPGEPAATGNAQAAVFIIHGTDRNGYVPQVEDVCRQSGLVPVLMMEQPNRGMGLPDKLRENMSNADYFVAVLTHDETTTEGGQRARQNAIAETLTANQNWPGRLAILREDEVEIPSNLQGLGYIQLQGQWSMRLLLEFRAAGLL